MNTGKKILITGGAGFIGSHLVRILIEQGISYKNLRLLIPEGESLDNLPAKDFDIIRADIRNKDAVKKAAEGVETIFHLAARIGYDGKRHTDYYDINVQGTKNILDSVKNNKIQKFVFFSSVAIFGLPAYVGDIHNWNEKSDLQYGDDYGKSKWEAEKVVMKAYDRYNIPYSIIRPTSVYGPGDKKNLLPLYEAIKKGYFFFIGNGKNKLDYVYVTDLIKGVVQAQKSPLKTGDYILGGGKTVPTLNEAVYSIAKNIGRNPTKIHVPIGAGYGISYITESMNKTFNFHLPFYPGRVRAMTSEFYFDITKAAREIEYNPTTSFSKGTKLMAEWAIKNNLL